MPDVEEAVGVALAPVTVGASLIGGGSSLLEGREIRDAGRRQERAARTAAEGQQEALESFERRTQPFADIGLSAGDPLQQLLGIAPQQRGGGIGPAKPGSIQQQSIPMLEEVNPLVGFLRDQGFEQIQESAAAGGRLGAGGTLKDLTEFNTQLGATVVPQLQQQRFNQLFNLLGLGSNVTTGQGTAGIQTAGNVGNLLQQGAAARGAGDVGFARGIGQGVSDAAGIFGAATGGFGFGGGGGGFNFLNPGSAGSAGVFNPNQFRGFS
jgi:hypothetical protein